MTAILSESLLRHHWQVRVWRLEFRVWRSELGLGWSGNPPQVESRLVRRCSSQRRGRDSVPFHRIQETYYSRRIALITKRLASISPNTPLRLGGSPTGFSNARTPERGT